MLQMRARSWALRDAFADVLRGIQSVEEVRDIPEVIDVTPTPPALPEPKAATKAEQVLSKVRAKKPRPPEPEPVAAAAAEPEATEPEATEPAAEIDRSRIEEIGRRWAGIYQTDHGFVVLLRKLYRSSAGQAAAMSASVDRAIATLDQEDQEQARQEVLEIYSIIERSQP